MGEFIEERELLIQEEMEGWFGFGFFAAKTREEAIRRLKESPYSEYSMSEIETRKVVRVRQIQSLCRVTSSISLSAEDAYLLGNSLVLAWNRRLEKQERRHNKQRNNNGADVKTGANREKH